MNKLKKLLAALVCAAMTLALAPGLTAWAEENVTADGLEYEVYDGYVEITGCSRDAIDVDIPAEIEGMPVTSIGANAFFELIKLTSVTIPDSVTSIGAGAFYGCESLEKVNIPDGVTVIDEETFAWCLSLTDIKIPDSVITIGYSAFGGCDSITSINVPDSVTTIDSSAFRLCCSLKSVTIGEGVESIADRVFKDSENLTDIFVNDNNLYFRDIDGVLFDKDAETLIQYPLGKQIDTYVIPDGVTTIGELAFENCKRLKGVIIGDGVTDICDWAFNGCENLTSINIPDSVTSIGEYSFGWCSSLTSASLGNGLIIINEWAFYNCPSLTSVTIPDSVTIIGEGVFNDCASLTDVYYGGSEEDWENVYIGDYNDELLNANIHFNNAGPEPKIKAAVTPNVAGGLNVTVETVNVPATAELVTVALGVDGKVVDIALAENGEATLDGENAETVKVFCWESLQSMRPLCPAKKIAVTQ